MKTTAKHRSFMPPAGLSAKEHRAWVEAETAAALTEAAQGQTVGHDTVRKNILKRRLARVPAKAAA